MSWLLQAVLSSIGKKTLMGVTGLALCFFLVTHLGGNLLMYVGAVEYNHYAHTLHAQKTFLIIAETGLFLVFAAHIAMAFRSNAENAAARPVPYAIRQSKIPGQMLAKPASSVMMVSGVVVLFFLCWHLADFKLEAWNRGPEGEEPFTKAVRLLQGTGTAIVYIIGSCVLGYHLLHGFQSAFQSLGINHPRYTPVIKNISLGFALIIAVGFSSFPIYFKWVRPERPAPATTSGPSHTSMGVLHSPPVAAPTDNSGSAAAAEGHAGDHGSATDAAAGHSADEKSTGASHGEAPHGEAPHDDKAHGEKADGEKADGEKADEGKSGEQPHR